MLVEPEELFRALSIISTTQGETIEQDRPQIERFVNDTVWKTVGRIKAHLIARTDSHEPRNFLGLVCSVGAAAMSWLTRSTGNFSCDWSTNRQVLGTASQRTTTISPRLAFLTFLASNTSRSTGMRQNWMENGERGL